MRHLIGKLTAMGYNIDQYRGVQGKKRLQEAKQKKKLSPCSSMVQGQAKKAKTIADKKISMQEAITDEAGDPVDPTLLIPHKYWHTTDTPMP